MFKFRRSYTEDKEPDRIAFQISFEGKPLNRMSALYLEVYGWYLLVYIILLIALPRLGSQQLGLHGELREGVRYR